MRIDPRLKATDDLLVNLKAAMPEIDELHTLVERVFSEEDGLYRFYHQSFKVYGLQTATLKIVDLLEKLAPVDQPLNPWFMQIVVEGTGKQWKNSHNREWLLHTRPIVEAYHHAHYFLRMAREYGRDLDTAPNIMPSGWAALLELYGIR